MIQLLSDVAEVPGDLTLNLKDGCRYYSVPISKSEDGEWLVFICCPQSPRRDAKLTADPPGLGMFVHRLFTGLLKRRGRR